MTKWGYAAAELTASGDKAIARLGQALCCLTVLAVAAWMWAGPLPARAQTGTAAAGARVEQALKGTGFTYKTHNPVTWSIDLERSDIGKFKVIISNNEDIVVTFAIIAKKAQIRKTPQLMEALLSANHEYDYVKIGLDKDGDLFVRVDTPLRVIDSALLKSVIEQVANASREVFTKNAAFIKR